MHAGPGAAAVIAGMSVINGATTLNYTAVTADPHVLDASGTRATLQFSATPSCDGAACSIDGPAVGAYLVAGSASHRAASTLTYTFGITGPSALVPILVSGAYATFDPLELPRGAGGTFVRAVLRVRGEFSQKLFEFRSFCYNYPPEFHEQLPAEKCGTGLFSGSFFAASETALSVEMDAQATRIFDDRVPAAASAYMDPYFQIDPAWAASHPGYALSFDPGVGNGVPGAFGGPSAVPEPATLALMAAGLAALAGGRRWKAVKAKAEASA